MNKQQIEDALEYTRKKIEDCKYNMRQSAGGLMVFEPILECYETIEKALLQAKPSFLSKFTKPKVKADDDQTNVVLINSSTQSRVEDIISSNFGVDKNLIKPNSYFEDDLGLDDLDHIEMIMACEDEFSIEIPDADMERIKTVKQLVNFIEDHK